MLPSHCLQKVVALTSSVSLVGSLLFLVITFLFFFAYDYNLLHAHFCKMWNWKHRKGTKPNSLKTFLPANLITSYLGPTQETKPQRNAQHGNILRWQLKDSCILELITPFTFGDLKSIWDKINNSSNFKTHFSPTPVPYWSWCTIFAGTVGLQIAVPYV